MCEDDGFIAARRKVHYAKSVVNLLGDKSGAPMG